MAPRSGRRSGRDHAHRFRSRRIVQAEGRSRSSARRMDARRRCGVDACRHLHPYPAGVARVRRARRHGRAVRTRDGHCGHAPRPDRFRPRPRLARRRRRRLDAASPTGPRATGTTSCSPPLSAARTRVVGPPERPGHRRRTRRRHGTRQDHPGHRTAVCRTRRHADRPHPDARRMPDVVGGQLVSRIEPLRTEPAGARPPRRRSCPQRHLRVDDRRRRRGDHHLRDRHQGS